MSLKKLFGARELLRRLSHRQTAQTFVFLHDQRILEDYVRARKFSALPNLKYVFLGTRPTDRVENRTDVIIARNQPRNIEDKPGLVAWTGWYVIAKNGYVTADFVNLFEYDIDIHGPWVQSYSSCGYIPHVGRDDAWWNFNHTQAFVEAAIGQSRAQVYADSADDGPVSMTSNYTLSSSLLHAFVDEMDSITYSGEAMSGHIIERHCSFYMRDLLINHGRVAHYNLDSHDTQVGALAYDEVSNLLLKSARWSPNGLMRAAAVARRFKRKIQTLFALM